MAASSKLWSPVVFTVKSTRVSAGDDAGPAVAHLAARCVELGERRRVSPAGRNAQKPPDGIGSEDDLVAVAPAAAPVVAHGGEGHRRPALDRDLLQHVVGEEADPHPVGGEEGIRRSRRLGKRPRVERVHPPLVEPVDRPVGGDVGEALPVARDGEPAELVPGGAEQRPASVEREPRQRPRLGLLGPWRHPAHDDTREDGQHAAEHGDPRRDPPGPRLPVHRLGQGRRGLTGSKSDARLADVAQAVPGVAIETPPQQAADACWRRLRAAPSQSISWRTTAASTSVTVSPSKSRRPVSISKKHDAEGPDVGALVHGLAARLLGGHVGRGAEDDARSGSGVGEGGRLRQVGAGVPRRRRRSTPSRARSRAP